MNIVVVKNGKYNDPYNSGRLTINKKIADGTYLPMMGHLFLVSDIEGFNEFCQEYEEFLNDDKNDHFIDDLIYKHKGFDCIAFKAAATERIEVAAAYAERRKKYYEAFDIAEDLAVLSAKVVGFVEVSFSDTVRSSDVFYLDTYSVIELTLSNGDSVIIKGDATDAKVGLKYSQYANFAKPTKDWRFSTSGKAAKYKFTFNGIQFHI